jgi:uncharacterized membrane protein
MTELVIAVYDRTESADLVLSVLQARWDDLPPSLDSIAVVRIGSDGRVMITTSEVLGARGPLWGVLWEALFGMIFHVPEAGTAYGENLSGLFGVLERAGLDERFRERVRGVLGRGSSGLAMLSIVGNAEPILNQLGLRPDAVIRASFTPQQDLELQREVGG